MASLLSKLVPMSEPAIAPLPGPWGFLTSGYMLGLVLMVFPLLLPRARAHTSQALLIHRIQNIVVPPRRRPSSHTYALDFSSSLVRLVLRLPSLYFLSKSLLLWATTLAQTAHTSPPDALTSWVAQYDTPALCWFTFCSVCGALCLEALTRGLEGANSNASPFNLVCHLPRVPYLLTYSLSSAMPSCCTFTHPQ